MRKRHDRILPENQRPEEVELAVEAGEFDSQEGVSGKLIKRLKQRFEWIFASNDYGDFI